MALETSDIPVRDLPITSRTREIRKLFSETFGRNADFYIRLPGRVNLIGEHIDYCGYCVCPMALDQDILLAVSVENNAILHLYNTDPDFEAFQCNIDSFEISISDGKPKWYQYFLCGVKGILEVLPKDVKISGMNVLVNGTVPQSAGLSSSSALVSAAALATSRTHHVNFPKEAMADLCAKSERYIGTQGGGMDQAIAFLAKEGCAKLIEFNPLRSKDVVLPKDGVFVIAHSLENMNKAATSDFNCRVVECRLGAQLIAKKKGLQWRSLKRFADLQKALQKDIHEMISITEEVLHDKPYSKSEIAEELEVNLEQLEQLSLTPNTSHIETFKLKQRAQHVFEEALRVYKFYETCVNSTLSNDDVLVTLGRLMSESHESLRDLYECSHPKLDELVTISKAFTLGARLTGAGWGGCVVALLKSDRLDAYVDHLRKNYYEKYGMTDKYEKYLFSTAPQSGACIYV